MNGPSTSLGIIGASGRLGSALAKNAVEHGLVAQEALWLSSRAPAEASAKLLPYARWTGDNQELVDATGIVVISVRPEQFDGVRVDARGRTVVSLMAGVPMRVLVDRLNTPQVVRAMPNAAVEIGRSFTPWFAAPSVPPEDKNAVQEFLACCGSADEVPSEPLIDYLSGLTGSGPAYPALLADVMIRDAIVRGLDPDLARRAVVSVVAGAGQLVDGALAPSELVSAFMGYHGTTAAAIQAMLDAGLFEAVQAGLRAAEARAATMTSG